MEPLERTVLKEWKGSVSQLPSLSSVAYNVIQMREKPGFVVVADGSKSREQILDAICKELYVFYEQNGCLFVGDWYAAKPREKQFRHKVYGRLEPELKEKPVIDIKVEEIGEQKFRQFVKEWDFPHAPREWTERRYAVYFNSLTPAGELVMKSLPEDFKWRDDFLRYLQRKMPDKVFTRETVT
jgi:hypothetical protein